MIKPIKPMIGKLYSVATPIGNLSDITFRAVEILRSVDLIAAEDTRHSAILLQYYQVETPLISYHHHNEVTRSEELVAQLLQGKHIALISDAGTPLISDPGAQLISLCQQQAIPVVPIPGPSALISALSVSGLVAQPFTFLGFLPAKTQQREAILRDYIDHKSTIILYEAPHRIVSLLQSCVSIFADKRQICLAKELTKTHETIKTATAAELLAWLDQDPARQKGEFVLIISVAELSSNTSGCSINQPAQLLLQKLTAAMPTKQACQIVSEVFELNKNQLYQLALEFKNKN